MKKRQRTKSDQEEFDKILDDFFIGKESYRHDVFDYLGSKLLTFFININMPKHEVFMYIDSLKISYLKCIEEWEYEKKKEKLEGK
ncbi:MAG TPA: hypothetical protein VF465_21155 [Flavobacterium sp.]|uniref:hypothetical protein n=1 Tax=Flavobacterium sp. TaxID=239 RepID=UPI002ED1EA17